MKIVFISDTHNLQDQVTLPEGDILVHAGDLTMMGRMNEIAAAGHDIRKQPHRYKVVVAGNHDWMFAKNRMMAVQLLNNGLIGGERKGRSFTLRTAWSRSTALKSGAVRGSQPSSIRAFNAERGEAIKRYWDMIPEGLDILVTHGPPMGIHDQIAAHLGSEHLGCEELMKAVERVKPKIHVFGHIHGGYGKTQYVNTLFINAAICNEAYKAVNEPIVIELPDAKTEEQKEST